jgi:hypothetical protein
MLFYGFWITLVGLSMALWPTRRTEAVEKRIAQGDDGFFEERRTYRAYPYLRDPRRIRLLGILCAIGGPILCLSVIYRG